MDAFLPTYTPGLSAIFNPASPTAPASTAAYKMQGLAAQAIAQKSGNFLFLVTAVITAAATTVGNGINVIPYCGLIQGSNVAPTNTAAVPSNAIQLGSVQSWATGVTLTTFADSLIPITVVGLAQQLQFGQQYWFDLAAESITTASDNQLTQISVILIEV